MRDAAGSPKLVELGERAIDDRADGPWMTDGSDTSDRLAGVFAYERRRGATERTLLFSDLDHVHSMCTTGHDQQRRPGGSLSCSRMPTLAAMKVSKISELAMAPTGQPSAEPQPVRW